MNDLKIIEYFIGVDTPVTPDEKLPDLPEIPKQAIVVINGRAPIWRYCMALHKLHGSPASVICVNDPRLGAVVVASHNKNFKEGQIIQWEKDKKEG